MIPARPLPICSWQTARSGCVLSLPSPYVYIIPQAKAVVNSFLKKNKKNFSSSFDPLRGSFEPISWFWELEGVAYIHNVCLKNLQIVHNSRIRGVFELRYPKTPRSRIFMQNEMNKYSLCNMHKRKRALRLFTILSLSSCGQGIRLCSR